MRFGYNIGSIHSLYFDTEKVDWALFGACVCFLCGEQPRLIKYYIGCHDTTAAGIVKRAKLAKPIPVNYFLLLCGAMRLDPDNFSLKEGMLFTTVADGTLKGNDANRTRAKAAARGRDWGLEI